MANFAYNITEKYQKLLLKFIIIFELYIQMSPGKLNDVNQKKNPSGSF